jgi:hypothetical protein
MFYLYRWSTGQCPADFQRRDLELVTRAKAQVVSRHHDNIIGVAIAGKPVMPRSPASITLVMRSDTLTMDNSRVSQKRSLWFTVLYVANYERG